MYTRCVAIGESSRNAATLRVQIVISGNKDGIAFDLGGVSGHSLFQNAVYLEDEAFTIPETDLIVYGSPWTPKFRGGFQLTRPEQARVVWANIPDDVDILVTHGPPRGILDRSKLSVFEVA